MSEKTSEYTLEFTDKVRQSEKIKPGVWRTRGGAEANVYEKLRNELWGGSVDGCSAMWLKSDLYEYPDAHGNDLVEYIRPLLSPELDAAKAEIERLEDLLKRMTNERNHWQANHANLADAKRCMVRRQDLIELPLREKIKELEKELILLATKNAQQEIVTTEPPSTIGKPGVYQHDNRLCTVTDLENDWGFDLADGNKSGFCAKIHPFPDYKYLAPLPPNGVKLLNVKPGELLPKEFWYYDAEMGEWQHYIGCGHETAFGLRIYAAEHTESAKPVATNFKFGDFVNFNGYISRVEEDGTFRDSQGMKRGGITYGDCRLATPEEIIKHEGFASISRLSAWIRDYGSQKQKPFIDDLNAVISMLASERNKNKTMLAALKSIANAPSVFAARLEAQQALQEIGDE